MNHLNQLCSVLTGLGLSSKEIKIYKILLNTGLNTPSVISKLSNIDRSTCYKHLDKLKHVGLITETRLNKQKAFVPEHPKTIINLLNKKHENIILQKKIAKTAVENLRIEKFVKSFKPVVQYFEGIEGIKKMYLETLKQPKEIKIFFGWDFYTDDLRSFINEEYIPNRVKNNIQCKVITNNSIIENRDNEELRTRKKIDCSFSPNVEINIYGDSVNFTSILGDNYSGLMIKNKEIAKSLEDIFDALWEKTNLNEN